MTTFDDLPLPSKSAQLRCQTLTKQIRELIEQRAGFIPFSTFMTAALYHPTLGYYQADTLTLGKSGDFTTAPEISPLFARCFARQCADIFNTLQPRNLLELGAGSGRMAADILSTLQQLQALPDHYYIVEISIPLRIKQQTLLKTAHPDFFPRIIWLDTLPADFSGIIIANEVLDALAVDCFSVQTSVMERGVGWENDQFIWRLATLSADREPKVNALIENYSLPMGYASEIHTGLAAFMPSVIKALKTGVILFADYGYGRAEYYHPERTQGTLTCFYQHFHHANPFYLPGLQDITAHVDFTTVAEIAVDNGCTLSGYTTQAAFLLACGLLDFAAAAEAGASPTEAFTLHQAIKTLTLPTEMGERIKIMALEKDIDLPPLLGFSFQDRRRDL